MAGVFRLRGDVVPVVDLARRLGLPPGEPSRRAKYVVVTVGGRLLGLMVDEVCEVLRLARQELRPAPVAFDAKGARLFLGVCDGELGAARGGRRDGAGRLRLLLNVKALLEPAPDGGRRGGARPAGGQGGSVSGDGTLLAQARHPDEETRYRAVLRLDGAVPEELAELLARLSDSSWRVRSAAVERFAGLADPGAALPRLIDLLDGAETIAGRAAAEAALASLGAAALPALLVRLASSSGERRLSAIAAVGRHRQPPGRAGPGGLPGRSRPEPARRGRRGARQARWRRGGRGAAGRARLGRPRSCGPRPWTPSARCRSRRRRRGSRR